MNQIVFLLYSGTIQLQVERDLKLTRFSANISLYLAKFMKHNKSNTTFVHEIVIIFSPIIRDHLCDQLIQFKDRDIKVNSRCNNYSVNLQITLGKSTIYVAFIYNRDCPNRFSFDGHPIPNSCSNISYMLLDLKRDFKKSKRIILS